MEIIMTTRVIADARHETRFGFAAAVDTWMRNWRSRRSIARLCSFDDAMLRDIGVTREDLRWAAKLPLAMNAAVALENRVFRQRQMGRVE
jgi:uncharacterized protein YjiS (DUF1127 family)